DNVRTDGMLDLDRPLGREAMHRTVVMRSKGYPFFIDHAEFAVALGQLPRIKVDTMHGRFVVRLDFPGRELGHAFAESGAEREDLETAGVGHGRQVPIGELVESSRLLDDVMSRL